MRKIPQERGCQIVFSLRELKACIDWRKKLTLILLTCTKWRALAGVGKWRMGFNSAFKRLIIY
jgi:hypothetical protein